MDYLELQQRANQLVNKVNEYEESLIGQTVDENEILNQHKYVDLFCLRPVLKLLFGATIQEKLSRTLLNDIDLKLFSSKAPAWNTKFSMFTNEVETDSHSFVQNIDMINNYNMLQLDVQQNTETSRDDRIQKGINYSYSANIQDALVTESQVANIFKWNTTTDIETQNNTVTINRQVPGIVCYYLGNDYNSTYTATIPYNPSKSNINSINYSTPPYYGAYYVKDNQTASQVGLQMGAEACRIFMLGSTYTRGQLISPQQIWQPDRIVGEANEELGHNWQGQAIYHELVFKNRRSGCEEANVDFVPAMSSVPDNDPQGLATRLALSKQKPYYYNRPWFKELDGLTDINSQKLTDNINTAKIDYEVYDSSKFTIYGLDVSDTGIASNFSQYNRATRNYDTTDVSLPARYQPIENLVIEFRGKFNLTTTGTKYFMYPSYTSSGLYVAGRLGVYKNGTKSILGIDITVNTATTTGGSKWYVLATLDTDVWYNIRIIVKYNTLECYVKTDNEQDYSLVYNNTLASGNRFAVTEAWNASTSYIAIGQTTTSSTDYMYNSSIDLQSIFMKYKDDVLISKAISSNTRLMDDSEFYNNYKLDYKTFAENTNQPL